MRLTLVPIVPRQMPGGLDPDQVRRAISNALTATAEAMRVDYETTVATWLNRPPFRLWHYPDYYSRQIYTEDEIYYYVNHGTRPHPILPRNATRLAFPANFAAKTTPNVIGSRPGGSSGPTVFSPGVQHPGTTGRRFDKAISEKWQREWPVQLQRTLAAL